MCIVCTEWEKQKLTSAEAFRAIGEMVNTSKDKEKVEHLKALSEKIIEKEVPQVEFNAEADEAWWKSTHKESDDQ